MIFRFWCVQLWKKKKIPTWSPPSDTCPEWQTCPAPPSCSSPTPCTANPVSPWKAVTVKTSSGSKKAITLLLPEADREVRASPWCCALGQCCWFYSTDSGTCKQSDLFSHNLSLNSHTCSCSPHEFGSSYQWQSSSSESHSEKVFHPHRPSHNSGNTNVRQAFIRSQMNLEAKIFLDLNCLLPVGEAFVIFLLCLLHLLLLRFHHLPLNFISTNLT